MWVAQNKEIRHKTQNKSSHVTQTEFFMWQGSMFMSLQNNDTEVRRSYMPFPASGHESNLNRGRKDVLFIPGKKCAFMDE